MRLIKSNLLVLLFVFSLAVTGSLGYEEDEDISSSSVLSEDEEVDLPTHSSSFINLPLPYAQRHHLYHDPMNPYSHEHYHHHHQESHRRSPRAIRNTSRLNVTGDYDAQMSPPTSNGTGIPVRFGVLIFSVREISEILQQITIEMRLQIYWKDSRLDSMWKQQIPPNQKYVTIPEDVSRHIWHPDIVIDFAKEILQPKLLGTTPISLRYYNTGSRAGFLRTSTRLTLKMSCPMDFHLYPVDKQNCSINLKSYGYTNDALQIEWEEGENALCLERRMDLPNFKLGLDHPRIRAIKTGSGNFYSSVEFSVLLRRKLSYHTIQTFIPSSVFVIISWLSFFVPPESVPGRMAICMTTLLSQATMFSGIRANIPKVSYIKALDIWMVACIFFVFLTLVEYTVVLKLRSLIAMEEAKQLRMASLMRASDDQQKPNALTLKVTDHQNSGPTDPLSEPPAKIYNKFAFYTEQLERYTWMVCIALFVIFNFAYWPWLLSSAQYYSQVGQDLYYKKHAD